MLQNSIEELIDLVRREQIASLEQDQFNLILSDQALVNLGYAIDGLYINSQIKEIVLMKCQYNESRFRPGDRLTFTSPNRKPFAGIVTAVEGGGKDIYCRTESKSLPIGSGPWVATENTGNLSAAILSTLQKLQPGSPGWGLVKRLFGEKIPALPQLFPPIKIDSQKIYSDMVRETEQELDPSQQMAFHKCLEMPALIGVQGPPGTGKTMLLGFVAEGLVRAGKRIVIVAPTHQAVNNALSTIKKLLPNRSIVKVGDELRTESLEPSIPILTNNKVIKELPVETIIGMTFMSAMHRLLNTDQRLVSPNVVLIDEAGQLPLSQGVCTALCGAGSIFLFGDDRQMPPIFSGEVGDDDLAVSAFAQLRRAQPTSILMLSITHRLNQELCQHIGNTFYADATEPLVPSVLAKDRLLIKVSLPENIDKSTARLLEPSNSFVWAKISSDTFMQSNELEAIVVSRLVSAWLLSGNQENEIAVVTPFRRQARLITNFLNKEFGNSIALPIIDTVERVQGATVDLVIYSFCASQPDYICSLANFLFSPNRLNVAISRARRKAVFISSPDIFNVLPREHKGIVGRNVCRKLLEGAESFFPEKSDLMAGT